MFDNAFLWRLKASEILIFFTLLFCTSTSKLMRWGYGYRPIQHWRIYSEKESRASGSLWRWEASTAVSWHTMLSAAHAARTHRVIKIWDVNRSKRFVINLPYMYRICGILCIQMTRLDNDERMSWREVISKIFADNAVQTMSCLVHRTKLQILPTKQL